MSIIAWVLTGVAAGWLATTLLQDAQGLASYIALGVLGALVGGVGATVVLHANPVQLTGSVAVAALGAALLIGGAHFLFSGVNAEG